MAITTLNTVKAVLQIADATKDTLITTLMPLVEADYLNIRNKPFDEGITITIDDPATADDDLIFTVGTTDITVPVLNGDSVNKIARMVALALGGTYTLNVVTLLTVNDYTLNATTTGVTATISNVEYIYPIGAEQTAIGMISHLINTANNTSILSESLGDYSVTFDKGMSAGGYPKSITSAIRKYVSYV